MELSRKIIQSPGLTHLLFVILTSAVWSCGSLKLKHVDLTVPAEENWNLYGGRPNRVNYRNKNLSPPLEHRWTYKATSAVGKALTVANGVLYFGTMDGRIDAVAIETGEKLGRLKIERRYEATCAFFQDHLVLALRYGDETLVLYDLSRGEQIWQVNAGDIASEPLVTSDGIYVSALYNHIDKYAFETGEKIWTFKTEDQHRSSPAISGKTLVVGCDDGTIYALDSESGELKWKVSAGASVFATPIIEAETVFVGSADSVFYALDLLDGKILWQFKAERPIYEAAATDGERVVFGSSGGQLYCLDFETGSKIWGFKAQSVISTAPLILNNVVFFGSLDKNYYSLDLENGNKVWSFETKGRIRTSLVVWGNFILGASEDRFLYAFSCSK